MTYLVKEFMSKEIVTIAAEANVAEASKKIAENPRGYTVVLQNGQPTGMVTERDLVRKVFSKSLDPSKVKVLDVMSSPLVSIDPDEELSKAAETMKANDVRKLPVAREGILYGIINARDIADHFNEYVDKAIKEIIKYSAPFRF
jgi:CBS domain-containing protein